MNVTTDGLLRELCKEYASEGCQVANINGEHFAVIETRGQANLIERTLVNISKLAEQMERAFS